MNELVQKLKDRQLPVMTGIAFSQAEASEIKTVLKDRVREIFDYYRCVVEPRILKTEKNDTLSQEELDRNLRAYVVDNYSRLYPNSISDIFLYLKEAKDKVIFSMRVKLLDQNIGRPIDYIKNLENFIVNGTSNPALAKDPLQ